MMLLQLNSGDALENAHSDLKVSIQNVVCDKDSYPASESSREEPPNDIQPERPIPQTPFGDHQDGSTQPSRSSDSNHLGDATAHAQASTLKGIDAEVWAERVASHNQSDSSLPDNEDAQATEKLDLIDTTSKQVDALCPEQKDDQANKAVDSKAISDDSINTTTSSSSNQVADNRLPSPVEFQEYHLQHEHTPPELREEDYHVGQVLELNLLSDNARSGSNSAMRLEIRQIYSKTLSCVMLVDILDQGSSKRLPSSAVLKLYDRRFAEGFREQKRHDPWERDIEEGYVEFVRTGEFDKLIRGIHQLPRKVYKYEPQGGEEWYDGECEAALADELHEMFKEETAVYKTLRNLQGLLIPKLLAKVELDIAPPQVDTNPVDGLEPFKIKGILMQRLEGFPLREISHRCPRSAWQDIVDQAISLTRIFSDYDIINNDVRTENFIISECKPDQEYRVYIIDFGNCRHRRKGESDFEWCRENSLKGQDGYIASVMAKVLEKHEFNLEYEDDDRWEPWTAKENFQPPADSGWVLEIRDGCKVWVHPDYEGAVYHLEV